MTERHDLLSISIRPPSVRQETLHVVRFGALVLLTTWVAVAGGSGARANGSLATDLLPYQVPLDRLAPADQRTFRLLQEGSIEAERARSASRESPAVSTLAGGGIPPFASDPITAKDGYLWSLRRSGIVADYLGVPTAPARSAFLLRIQEPAPGDPPDRAPLDETHHRLADGTMLHVSTWVHPRSTLGSRAVSSVPPDSGWSQVMIGAAPETSR